jgi:hypothetical protein
MEGKEFFYRSIVGAFNIVGKITGRQLILTSVIGYTVTADPLAGTGVVGTITTLLIHFDLAFHNYQDLCKLSG